MEENKVENPIPRLMPGLDKPGKGNKLTYGEAKKNLANAVFIYVTDTLNRSPGKVPSTVSRPVFSAAKQLDAVAVELSCPSGFAITSAIQTSLTDTLWQGIIGKIPLQSVRTMNYSLGALVTKFGGNADNLMPRFNKLLELAEVSVKAVSSRALKSFRNRRVQRGK
jgi:hypothetical protein